MLPSRSAMVFVTAPASQRWEYSIQRAVSDYYMIRFQLHIGVVSVRSLGARYHHLVWATPPVSRLTFQQPTASYIFISATTSTRIVAGRTRTRTYDVALCIPGRLLLVNIIRRCNCEFTHCIGFTEIHIFIAPIYIK